MAEVVLFGDSHPVSDGLRVEAGPSIVVVVEGDNAVVSCFRPDEPDLVKEVDSQVEDILHAIVDCEADTRMLFSFYSKRQQNEKLKVGLRSMQFLQNLMDVLAFQEKLWIGIKIKKKRTIKVRVRIAKMSQGYWPSFDTALSKSGT